MLFDQIRPFLSGSGPVRVAISIIQPARDIPHPEFHARRNFPDTGCRQLAELQGNPVMSLMRTGEFHNCVICSTNDPKKKGLKRPAQ